MLQTLLEQAPSLTPTSLILLLNVLIATILISSAFHNHHNNNNQDNENNHDHISPTTPPPQTPPQLTRAPSLFSRVTSFNFSHNHHDDHHHHPQLNHTQSSPFLLSRVTSFKLLGQTETQPGPDHEDVTQSCPVTPAASANRVTKSMRRAPSFLSRVASFPLGMRNAHIEIGGVNTHQENENRSSNDNKEEKAKRSKKKKNGDEIRKRNEAEVDAKADAFINKFKQQLKLQRLDSFMRYRTTTAT